MLAACGGGEEPPERTEPAGGCDPVEQVEVADEPRHLTKDFTQADYDSNPPAGGDHSRDALATGRFYHEAPPLGETVHALEHGAVIGWTNGLSEGDQEAVENAFNEVFADGYYQLTVIEHSDLEVPFALSAWGAVQRCESVDTAAIRPFVEEHYASGPEGTLACEGPAGRLPACAEFEP